MTDPIDRPVLYYDGACGLCSRAVRALAVMDTRNIFAVKSLQSPEGQAMLQSQGMPVNDFETMVVQSGDKVYTKSDAVMEIFRVLGGPWRVVATLKLLPRPVRDCLYMTVSRNRLKIFGKSDSCDIPSAAVRRKLAPALPDSNPAPPEPVPRN